MKKIILILMFLLSACTHPELGENAEAARANLDLANAYLEHGDYAQAKAKLLIAARLAPHEAMVWNTWAYYADLTGEAEAADLYYRKALRLESRWGILHNNYGVFLCRQGHYALATQQFQKAVQDPSYLYPQRAYHNASVCAARAGNQQAAAWYEQKAAHFH